MHVFIDFWKLETENNILHVFSFLHKLSFENSFCFLPVLNCQTSFLVSKIENCFWRQKIRGKNSYQTYPKYLGNLWSIWNNWKCTNFSSHILLNVPHSKLFSYFVFVQENTSLCSRKHKGLFLEKNFQFWLEFLYTVRKIQS